MVRRALPRSIAGAVAVAAVAVSSAPAAAAPTLAVTNPTRCYVNTYSYSAASGNYTEHYASVAVKGAGWTPGADVELGLGFQVAIAEERVGADGTFADKLRVPDPPISKASGPTWQSAPVTATDRGTGDGSDPGGATAQSANVAFTDRSVTVWEGPQTAYGQNSDFEWNDSVTFDPSGFTPGKPIYAHYLFRGYGQGTKARLITTTTLGKASGPCGSLSRRAHIFPFKPPQKDLGAYTIQFDASKRYSARTAAAYPWSFNL